MAGPAQGPRGKGTGGGTVGKFYVIVQRRNWSFVEVQVLDYSNAKGCPFKRHQFRARPARSQEGAPVDEYILGRRGAAWGSAEASCRRGLVRVSAPVRDDRRSAKRRADRRGERRQLLSGEEISGYQMKS